jgi:hypothetical protein
MPTKDRPARRGIRNGCKGEVRALALSSRCQQESFQRESLKRSSMCFLHTTVGSVIFCVIAKPSNSNSKQALEDRRDPLECPGDFCREISCSAEKPCLNPWRLRLRGDAGEAVFWGTKVSRPVNFRRLNWQATVQQKRRKFQCSNDLVRYTSRLHAWDRSLLNQVASSSHWCR